MQRISAYHNSTYIQNDCTEAPSQIEYGVSRCDWNGADESCTFRPPPATPVFTIMVALLTMLASIPIVLLLHYVLNTYCCKQPGPVLKRADTEDPPPLARNLDPFQNQTSSDSNNRNGSRSVTEKPDPSRSFTKVPFQDQKLTRSPSVQFQVKNERIDPYRADGVYSTEESSKRICRSRSELGDVIRRVANVQPQASITDDDLARYAFTGKDSNLDHVVMYCIASHSIHCQY